MHNLDATKRCLFSFYFKTAVFGIEFSLCTHSKRIKTWRRIQWKLLVDDKCLTMVNLIQLFLIIFKKKSKQPVRFVCTTQSLSINSRFMLHESCYRVNAVDWQLCVNATSNILFRTYGMYSILQFVFRQTSNLFGELIRYKRVNRMLCLWFMMQSNCY